MRRTLTAALALFVGFVMLFAANTAQADHSSSGSFHFRGSIDADGAKTPDADLGIHYDRELHGDTPTLDAEAGWVDGDRRGYRCGFAFLEYRGFIVGRVTISAFRDPGDPKNAGYVKVNDKQMHEQARNFDGTVNTTGKQAKGCTTAAEEYEPLDGPATNPVVTFQHGPHAIDVRDFSDELDVSADDDVVFDLVSATATQVVIVAYAENGTLPILTVYYDLIPDLDQGVAVGATTPGTDHPVTLHVDCGTKCGGHGHHEPPEEPTPDPGPEPLVGDLDGDGRVNVNDLQILTDNWTG